MTTPDFFRSRIDAMIHLNDPLAVLATRLPWAQLEAALAVKFEHQARQDAVLERHDQFGPTQSLVGASASPAGRPRLPLRLMISLLYLKHADNLSDEELVVRWSENVLWQFFSGRVVFEHRLLRIAEHRDRRFRRNVAEDSGRT